MPESHICNDFLFTKNVLHLKWNHNSLNLILFSERNNDFKHNVRSMRSFHFYLTCLTRSKSHLRPLENNALGVQNTNLCSTPWSADLQQLMSSVIIYWCTFMLRCVCDGLWHLSVHVFVHTHAFINASFVYFIIHTCVCLTAGYVFLVCVCVAMHMWVCNSLPQSC